MDNGWIGIEHSPVAAEEGPIIAWHVFSGVMVELRSRAVKNRFITHWREIDNTLWIPSSDHKPNREDADAYDCVISLNKWDEVSMAGWHRFERETDLLYWQHPPDPPANFRDLRKRMD